MATAQTAFKKAAQEWTRLGFKIVMKEVTANLTGRMMKRRTGRTLQNVERHSKALKTIIRIKTTSPSLIAWMEGSSRKAFHVAPIRAKALAWRQNGKLVFSRGHWINAWRFNPRRPVFEDAYRRTDDALVDLAADSAIKAIDIVIGPQLRARAKATTRGLAF